jgi:acylphosphatase
MNHKVRKRLLISGRVQGVFFRMETKRLADRIGLTGWVRNTPDGQVEAVFEGDEDLVDQAVSWCRNGPSRSNVTGIHLVPEKYSGEFTSFDIAY